MSAAAATYPNTVMTVGNCWWRVPGWLGVLLAALLAAGVSAQEPDPWAADLAAAQRHLVRGRLARAEAGFDDVLVEFEDAEEGDERPSPEVVRGCRQGLFEIALIGGQYAEVIGGISALPAAEQQTRGPRLLLARALVATGAYARAEAELRAQLGLQPADFEAGCRLGFPHFSSFSSWPVASV